MRAQRAAFLWSGGTPLLALVLMIPGLAGAQPAPVRPILECVTQEGPSQYTAVYGYKNENAFPITIPVGSSNEFTPTPRDRGQTTVFQPGRAPYDQGALRVPFPGSNLVWTLKGPDGGTRTSTASANSKRCPGPTLAGLDPASLSLVQGGSGVLTATISAVQASATTITLTSSDPAVASVPMSVSVPTGAVTVPVPVVTGAPGAATITAFLKGSGRQSMITVLPAGPTLTSLLPATLQVTQGANGTLTVTISAAQGTDTVVPLGSTDVSIASVPATVSVPTGAVTVPVPVAAVAAGTATVTAGPLNGTSAHSQVAVIPPPPAVVSLAPPVLPLTEGSSGTLTVTLNASQPTDTGVTLTTSDPAVVGLPADHLTVPAHTLAVPFAVTGLARGTATVTASLNGTTATSAVTVQPPLPTVQAFACPATLTVGATGQCTVTLNATQITDTLVPLATSDLGIVTVPESVTVVAGAVAVAVPVAAGSPGIATITAGPLNATTRQASLQVQPLPPTLVGLTPSPTTILVGASTTLTLTLNAAQAADTAVALASTPNGIVTLPPSITVPAGQFSVPVPITGFTPGATVVTAGPLNGSTAAATVTVNQLPPTVTGLTPLELSLPKGTADSLTVTIAPVQADPTAVPLASSDAAIVEVPASVPVPAGSATAAFPAIGRNVGTVTVTAGPLGGTTAQATVTVNPPTLVTLTIAPAAVTLAVGQTQAVTATGTYTDGTTQDLTSTAAWTSSHEAVATVTNPGGVVTARAVGQAIITVTAEGKTATATVTVTPPALTVLALAPTLPTHAVGQAVQFHVTGTYTDGTTQDLTGTVTWTSSDATVASITFPAGLATAVAAGQTTITATHADGMTVSTTLTVFLRPPTVTRFTPSSGKVGSSVTITGTFLGSTASVAFNGTRAAVTVVSSTQVTATVPPGATSGPIGLTTPGGSVTTPGHFLVLPTPDVSLSVAPGTVTAIAGTTVALKITVGASGGFAGLTTLSTGTLPEGVTGTFSSLSLGPNLSGTLTLTTSASIPASSTIEVRGTATIDGTAVTRTASATLTVQPPGQTILVGQVRDEDAQPLAGVSIQLGGSTITPLGTTDAAGNFRVPVPVAGTQTILIDGSTASGPNGGMYFTIPVSVTIELGGVNTLGFSPHLALQAPTQPLPVAPATATPVTFATIPDFHLTIPAGVRIIGWDGQANNQIGLRAVPLDRLPLPPIPAGLTTNMVYMFSFGKVGGGVPQDAAGNRVPVPVTFPNTIKAYPGQAVELWYYNEAPDGSRPNRWESYGLGTVSSDGRLIVSNPGVGIPQFCCGAGFTPVPPPPQNIPPDETTQDPSPDPTACCTGGDPIELSSGIFLHEATDLTLPGRLPVVLRRLYRTNSPTVGPIGVGTSTGYDAYLRQKTSDLVILFLPGNYKSRWAKQPDGSFTVGDKGTFRGARLTKNGDATWTLRYKDGRLWQFNSAGWLVAQQDRNGNVLTIQRDSQNRLTTLREPGGREVTLSYNGSDTKIQSVTDPLGRQVRYTYDGSNRLTAVTDPANGTWQYTYDNGHRMLTVTNPRTMLQTQNTYDAAGRVQNQTLADTGVTRFDYTVVAGTIAATTVTDPTGVARTSRFTGGYNTEATDGLGQSTKTLRRAGTNLVRAQTDPLGRTTQFTYDAAGNLTQRLDALNQPWTSTYDPVFNQVTSSTDPLGNRTTFAYDAQGNLTAITDPEENAKPEGSRLPTTFTYNPFGQPLTVTDPLGHTTTFEYDPVGNLDGDHRSPRPPDRTDLRRRLPPAHRQRPQGGHHPVGLRPPRPPRHHHRPAGRRHPVHLRPQREPPHRDRRQDPDHNPHLRPPEPAGDPDGFLGPPRALHLRRQRQPGDRHRSEDPGHDPQLRLHQSAHPHRVRGRLVREFHLRCRREPAHGHRLPHRDACVLLRRREPPHRRTVEPRNRSVHLRCLQPPPNHAGQWPAAGGLRPRREQPADARGASHAGGHAGLRPGEPPDLFGAAERDHRHL